MYESCQGPICIDSSLSRLYVKLILEVYQSYVKVTCPHCHDW